MSASDHDRWRQRPDNATWGDYGPDDQLGRLNLLTPDNTIRAAREIKTGRRFCLSLPLTVPPVSISGGRRKPPVFHPVMRGEEVGFNFPLEKVEPGNTAVNSDEAVTIWSQHSTQWDALGHMGAMFDAEGDGVERPLQYNGFSILDAEGKARWGDVGAWHCGIEHMARHGMQGRGVMINLKAHFGLESCAVGYDDLMRVFETDGIEPEPGDILCIYTGFADLLLESGDKADSGLSKRFCAALDGWDDALLRWISDSQIAAIASDSRTVEFEYDVLKPGRSRAPKWALHETCLFKLGVHLGELWFLTELAEWLAANGRYRFFLTAQPLHLPGAVGSPANGVATV